MTQNYREIFYRELKERKIELRQKYNLRDVKEQLFSLSKLIIDDKQIPLCTLYLGQVLNDVLPQINTRSSYMKKISDFLKKHRSLCRDYGMNSISLEDAIKKYVGDFDEVHEIEEETARPGRIHFSKKMTFFYRTESELEEYIKEKVKRKTKVIAYFEF